MIYTDVVNNSKLMKNHFIYKLLILCLLALLPFGVSAANDSNISAVSVDVDQTNAGWTAMHTFYITTTTSLPSGTTLSFFYTEDATAPTEIGIDFSNASFSSSTILGTVVRIPNLGNNGAQITLTSALAVGEHIATFISVVNPDRDADIMPAVSTAATLSETSNATTGTAISIGEGNISDVPSTICGEDEKMPLEGLAVTVFGTNVYTTWDEVSESIGYRVLWHPTADDTDLENVEDPLSSTNYTVEGLSQSTEYNIIVEADHSSCYSYAANSEIVTTGEKIEDTRFTKPSVVKKKRKAQSLTIKLGGNADIHDSYTVQLFQGKKVKSAKKVKTKKNIDGGTKTYTFKKLQPDTTYWVRTQAVTITDETYKYSKKVKAVTKEN